MAFQLDYDQTKLWGACDSGDIPRLFAASAWFWINMMLLNELIPKKKHHQFQLEPSQPSINVPCLLLLFQEIRCHEHRIHVTTDLARNGHRSPTQRFVPSVPCGASRRFAAKRRARSRTMLPVSNAWDPWDPWDPEMWKTSGFTPPGNLT